MATIVYEVWDDGQTSVRWALLQLLWFYIREYPDTPHGAHLGEGWLSHVVVNLGDPELSDGTKGNLLQAVLSLSDEDALVAVVKGCEWRRARPGLRRRRTAPAPNPNPNTGGGRPKRVRRRARVPPEVAAGTTCTTPLARPTTTLNPNTGGGRPKRARRAARAPPAEVAAAAMIAMAVGGATRRGRFAHGAHDYD